MKKFRNNLIIVHIMLPFEIRKIAGRYCVMLLIYSSISADGLGQLPLNTGVRILSPRFFPGWQAQNVSYPFVLYDDTDKPGDYKMYYAGSSSTQVNESLWDQWVTGVVTSADAVSWTYPDNYEQILFARRFLEGDVVNPDEQATIFDSVFAIDAFVLKDGSVYKCWYTGWNGEIQHEGGGLANKINFRIGYATSPDGLNWTKVNGSAGAGSVLSTGNRGETDVLGAEDPYIIKENGSFRMWYVGRDGQSSRIHYAISSDGVRWTKKGVVMNLGGKGHPDELGTQSPVVIKRSAQYELWYQGKSGSTPNHHVMRAVSPDGINWKKVGEVILHPVAPEPSWPWSSITLTGNEKIFVGSILVQPDNSCQVFYARQYTAGRKLTYGDLTAPLSYIYTERVNP
ncbi:MAG: hypothetical protein WD824_24285 [Cyclobacteriaceae bacterium]